MARSRQKIDRALPTETKGKDPLNGRLYCRKCMMVKRATLFFSAVDLKIDSNGKMSICSECIDEIFRGHFIMASENFEIATMETCRDVNVRFEGGIVANMVSEQNHCKEKRSTDGFFGKYKRLLIQSQSVKIKDRDGTKDYDGLVYVPPTVQEIGEVYKGYKVERDVKKFWGPHYTVEEYDFLEDQFKDWTTKHDVRTKEQGLMFKYICQLQLDYEHKRAKKESVSSLLKDIQKAMEVAGVSPNKSKDMDGGRAGNTYSDFIKMIEENEPAEYYKDKELFADYDNLGQYCEDYITRPLLNFLGQQPADFYVRDDGEGGNGGDLLSEIRDENEEDEDDDLFVLGGGVQ